jgi:hypothetical protein
MRFVPILYVAGILNGMWPWNLDGRRKDDDPKLSLCFGGLGDDEL